MANSDPLMRSEACAVYLMQQGFNGPFKVGFGRDPNQRAQNLQVGNPDSIRVAHCEWFASDADAELQEREIHDALSNWRVRGEWFSSEPTCVDALEAITPWAVGKVRMGHEHRDEETEITKRAIEIATELIPEAVKRALEERA